ncbi:glycosyltransferase family 2 protein [Lederbergia panacisoli]|uniref:glycosyltransferase family 2 protein n=1 Tax=Lederbergia panacisoli TaxID=1255251 RepID=UPI00214BEEC3|nr:glycosyltransferase family 2 protein [Lederbergia panacisoli]MCR2823814.1 glycosyltransferase [Lederbergia panacisoli]
MNVVNKRVSVIIPTYKRDIKYLLRAIDSIKNQTYKNTEIVIIDDNPPNSNFRKKVQEFMKVYSGDPDVIYLMNSNNVGGSLARNHGIYAATGDYITFLDDDDEYLPMKVKKQLEFMVDNDCDMSFTDLKLVNENKVVLEYREYQSLKKFDKLSLLKYHIMRHLTGTPTFMFKSEKIKEIGGFDDAKMGQEFNLMLKSIEMNLKIRYLADCEVLAYRHNDGGISQGRNKIEGESELFRFKRKYYHLFSLREKMFISFRHYAVMVIAYKRNKNYCRAIFSGILMLLASPLDFIKEGFRFMVNKFRFRKIEY